MSAYYNENDPKAAAWLRELIKEKLIADGEVDERSIVDVDPKDLDGSTQCHFFAGIGGWSYALRLAGWPDDREVWTGSCPCQPFSCAGQRKGHADERHLWPAFYALIDQRRPAIAFGEQIASKDGREWLAGVRADLEGIGYAVGASDLCAASVTAPHRRQRIYWLANNERTRLERYAGNVRNGNEPGRFGAQPSRSTSESRAACNSEFPSSSTPEQSDTNRRCTLVNGSKRERESVRLEQLRGVGVKLSAGDNFWNRFELVQCRDGKARRFEPESFPLADGIPGRVALLRGYGNAIVPQVAAEFIKAAEEAMKQ